MPAVPLTCQIEAWQPRHPRWEELLAFVASLNQAGWVAFQAPFHRGSHLFVALDEAQAIAGFIRYVVQEIGADAELPAVQLANAPLLEAKILAFAVAESHRRQGIGRALQLEVLRRAKAQQLYQVRSHSSGRNQANHQLKLALGFAVHPIARGADDRGAYYIMPLRVDPSLLTSPASADHTIIALENHFTVAISAQPDPGLRRRLQRAINAYNEQAAALPPLAATPLTLTLHGGQGREIGGLLAVTFWDWLRIDLLVIDELSRRQGLGRRLLQIAESEARRRGCMHAYTSTFDFQALGFYEKLGYHIVGELTDHPPTFTLYWLRKEL